MFADDITLPEWELIFMAESEHQNGGALAVISNTLGELKSALNAITSDQATLREYMIRFDEKQRGWATKHEVGELTLGIRSDMNKIEAKADRALTRTDESSAALGLLGASMERLRDEVAGVRSDLNTRQAQVRGAWAIIKPSAAWVLGIMSVVVAAFLAGHFAN